MYKLKCSLNYRTNIIHILILEHEITLAEIQIDNSYANKKMTLNVILTDYKMDRLLISKIFNCMIKFRYRSYYDIVICCEVLENYIAE